MYAIYEYDKICAFPAVRFKSNKRKNTFSFWYLTKQQCMHRGTRQHIWFVLQMHREQHRMKEGGERNKSLHGIFSQSYDREWTEETATILKRQKKTWANVTILGTFQHIYWSYDKVQDSCYILRPRVWKKSENFILMFILILISVTRVFFHVDSVSKKKKFFRPSIFSQKWPFGVKNGQNGRFSRFKNILHPYFHLQCIQTI